MILVKMQAQQTKLRRNRFLIKSMRSHIIFKSIQLEVRVKTAKEEVKVRIISIRSKEQLKVLTRREILYISWLICLNI